jgi:hypothetical protein
MHYCGSPFQAVQPDDVHTIVLSAPCPKGDSIEMPIDRKNCHYRNTLQWDRKHDDSTAKVTKVSNLAYP